MPLFELNFKIRHDCKLGSLAKDYSMVRVYLWRIQGHCAVELVSEDNARAIQSVQDAVMEINEIEKVVEGRRAHLITNLSLCPVERILMECVEELDILPIWPVLFHRGWEYHRIVAFRHSDISNLLEKFRGYSFMPWILRKVPFAGFTEGPMTVTTDSLFAELTTRQADALLTAYGHGYYKIPRDSDIKTISERIKTPRTTFQEHLKKAENKIMTALVPSLHIWQHISTGGQSHPPIDNDLDP